MIKKSPFHLPKILKHSKGLDSGHLMPFANNSRYMHSSVIQHLDEEQSLRSGKLMSYMSG